MIHMGVRKNDFFHAGLHLFDCGQNTLNIATGIDDGRASAGLTFDNRTVLLIGSDRDDSALYRHNWVTISRDG